MTYLLARVEKFARFEGEKLAADPVMAHGKNGEVPHELYNFSVAFDGFIYGYLPKDGGGDLTRLGARKGDLEASNVTVIFISRGILCGYYRDSTVFSNTFRHPDGLKAGNSEIYCRVQVNPMNAFLIPEDKRKYVLDPKPVGTFPVLYGKKGTDWVDWFEKKHEKIRNTVGSEAKRRMWTKKIERYSDARKMALQEYGLKCECCGISHEDEIRASIFEVHHKVPYAENFETRPVNVSDLSVLCANCHRMIHRMPDIADVKALRDYLRAR